MYRLLKFQLSCKAGAVDWLVGLYKSAKYGNLKKFKQELGSIWFRNDNLNNYFPSFSITKYLHPPQA